MELLFTDQQNIMSVSSTIIRSSAEKLALA